MERSSSRKILSEKRLELTAGYEPSLDKGFSSTRSYAYDVGKGKPNTYEFVISKLKFNGEDKIFTWHPKAGYIRVDYDIFCYYLTLRITLGGFLFIMLKFILE